MLKILASPPETIVLNFRLYEMAYIDDRSICKYTTVCDTMSCTYLDIIII